MNLTTLVLVAAIRWFGTFTGSADYIIADGTPIHCESVTVSITPDQNHSAFQYSMASICGGIKRHYSIDDQHFTIQDSQIYYEGTKVGTVDETHLDFSVYVRNDDVRYSVKLEQNPDGTIHFEDHYSLDGLSDGYHGNLSSRIQME